VPPRHGKSDLVSRRFPAWHLMRSEQTAAHEVILASYSANLATDLSHSARRCYAEVAPRYGLGIDETRGLLAAWRTTKGGGVYAVGLGGTITGRGADILAIDDYLKGREEAESELIRDKVWDSFRNDLVTRRAPVSGIVIPCTRWHEDDLVGRIIKAQEDDPDFPRFELVRFPAQDEDGAYLFPERFSPQYYLEQKSTLGSYAWEALYQGDPHPRRGNMFRADLVNIVDKAPDGLLWARGWDLASTEKQRTKDDPDFTAGVKLALNGELWIDDVTKGQWSVGKRNARIVDTALSDGPGTHVGIECVAGYKDAFEQIRTLLAGKAVVYPVTPTRDKVARAAPIEPLFESGKVNLVRGPWNAAFLAECGAFPGGKHDDQIDAMVVAYLRAQGGRVRIGG